MRLKYRVFWFEDDEDFAREMGSALKTHLLDDLGLELELNAQQSGVDLNKLLEEGESYDLIVTDLNLDNNDIGDALIDRIRADKILTEVLMYSADGAAIVKVRDENPGLERVSFAVGRPALPEKLQRIVDLTVRKVQDVHNMRALVIAEAIDIEDQMLEIINSYFTASGDDDEKNVFIKKHVEEKEKYFKKQLGGIASLSAPQILEFVDKACGEMFTKYVALNRLLDSVKAKLDASKPADKEEITVLEQLRSELTKMNDEVIALRNDLAHVREERDEHGRPILKNTKQGRETVFDAAKYVEIRRNLRSHFDNLTKIAEQLA